MLQHLATGLFTKPLFVNTHVCSWLLFKLPNSNCPKIIWILTCWKRWKLQKNKFSWLCQFWNGIFARFWPCSREIDIEFFSLCPLLNHLHLQFVSKNLTLNTENETKLQKLKMKFENWNNAKQLSSCLLALTTLIMISY